MLSVICITLEVMYANYERFDKYNVCIIYMQVMSRMKGDTICILKHVLILSDGDFMLLYVPCASKYFPVMISTDTYLTILCSS